MENNNAISVSNVSKQFRLPHERTTTLKSHVTGFFRRRRGYEAQQALKDISFEIKKGEFFGIVGRNGSGKSTLLKILASIYQPTDGSVTVRGKLVPFIELGVGFNPELTGRENVYLNGALLGFSNKEIDSMYNDIVSFAELEKFMDQKLKNYSSGMQVRLAFSMAIRAQADILLVDEVLAVGDADFQRKCFSYFKKLKHDKKTVVFVSHDMSAIKEYCDRAIMIEKREIVASGTSDAIADKYTQMFIEEARKNDKTQTKNKIDKHIGNGQITITDVDVDVTEKNVVVGVRAQINDDVDKVIYGIHILSQDGKEVTAMNNRMINLPDIKKLKKNSRLDLTWKLQNVFSDGEYSVTLTLIDDLSNTLDWVIDAAAFNVRRSEKSTTAVLPPVTATHKMV